MLILGIIALIIAIIGLYKLCKQYTEFLRLQYHFDIFDWRSILLLLASVGMGALAIGCSSTDMSLDNRIVAIVITVVLLVWVMLKNARQIGWTHAMAATFIQMTVGLILVAAIIAIISAMTPPKHGRRTRTHV